MFLYRKMRKVNATNSMLACFFTPFALLTNVFVSQDAQGQRNERNARLFLCVLWVPWRALRYLQVFLYRKMRKVNATNAMLACFFALSALHSDLCVTYKCFCIARCARSTQRTQCSPVSLRPLRYLQMFLYRKMSKVSATNAMLACFFA